MTSSAHSSLSNAFSPQRILLFLPIAMGAGVAALLITAGATPLLVQRQQEETLVKEMRTKRADLPLIVRQLNQQRSELMKAQQLQARLVNLVAGTGQLRTVLAAMNTITQRHDVQITALELKPLVPYVPPPPPVEPADGEDPPPPPPPSDPLLRPGLEKRSALLSLKGSFPDLLLTLRELELLQVVVISDDLALLNNGSDGASTQLTLSLSAYGRSGVSE